MKSEIDAHTQKRGQLQIHEYSACSEEWDCNATVDLVQQATEQRAKFHGQQLVLLSQVPRLETSLGSTNDLPVMHTGQKVSEIY
eukprot:6246384-Amphidinium_carterae.1